MNAPAIPHTADFGRLADRAAAGGRINVVFLGGSLTWGANASDPQRTSYRALMGTWLADRFPHTQVICHDASIGGNGSRLGIFRLERDVLARKPDVVFLDFTINDNPVGTDLVTCACYETILRTLVGAGIPVVQALLAVRRLCDPARRTEPLARYQAHLRLAETYATAVGDTIAHIRRRVDAGEVRLDELWPFPEDPTHPDDAGYLEYFAAVRDGFVEAVATRRVCRVPPTPLYAASFERRERLVLPRGPLPEGWRTSPAFRYSWGMGLDGQSSRWLDGVAICAMKSGETPQPQPLRCTVHGTMLGFLGESHLESLDFQVVVDGRIVPGPDHAERWRIDTTGGWHPGGRFICWRVLAEDLDPGAHAVEIRPLLPPGRSSGELRIESLCSAGPS